MIRAVALWLRRSTTAFALPGLVALVVAAVFSRDGWQHEWAWALSWTASTSVLLAPVVAGLTAHDRAWRQHPSLVLLERTSPRGPWAALALPLATSLLGLVAWCLGAGVVVVRLVMNGAPGGPGLDQGMLVVEVAATVLAASFLGVAVGSLVPNRAAGPTAALAVYGTFILAPRLGLGGLFEVRGSVATLAGLRLSESWVAGSVLAHVSIAVACAAVVLTFRAGRPPTCVLGAGVAVAVLVAGLSIFGALRQDGRYVEVTEELVCAGARPEVCVPASLQASLPGAQETLADAYAALEGSGLELPERLMDDRGSGGRGLRDGFAPLELNASTMDDGRLSREDLLVSIVVPSPCAAYQDDEPPVRLLQAQAVVMEWVDGRLSDGGAGRAPTAVLDAYETLTSCGGTSSPPVLERGEG